MKGLILVFSITDKQTDSYKYKKTLHIYKVEHFSWVKVFEQIIVCHEDC